MCEDKTARSQRLWLHPECTSSQERVMDRDYLLPLAAVKERDDAAYIPYRELEVRI